MKYYVSIFLIAYISSASEASINPIPAVLGGNDAASGEFPFHAQLSIESNGIIINCGGSILSTRYILTAAQCTDSCSGSTQFNIILGSNILGVGHSKNHYTGRVKNCHPKYFIDDNGATADYDLAIIKLDKNIRSFRRRANIAPIKLIEEPYSKGVMADCRVTAIGFGQNNVKSFDNLQKATDLVIINEDACNSNQNYNGRISDVHLCTEPSSNSGQFTCENDKGAALILMVNNSPRLVGVSTFQMDPCDSGPSVFVRLNNIEVQYWIEKQAELN